MLDGTTDKQDARLMADIEAAPDAFDGGCAADVADPLTDVADEQIRREVAQAREHTDRLLKVFGRLKGISDVIDWLRANHYPAAAQAVALNGPDIAKFIEERAARGE